MAPQHLMYHLHLLQPCGVHCLIWKQNRRSLLTLHSCPAVFSRTHMWQLRLLSCEAGIASVWRCVWCSPLNIQRVGVNSTYRGKDARRSWGERRKLLASLILINPRNNPPGVRGRVLVGRRVGEIISPPAAPTSSPETDGVGDVMKEVLRF